MKTSNLDFGERFQVDYERDGEWFEAEARTRGCTGKARSRRGYATALAHALEDLANRLKELDK